MSDNPHIIATYNLFLPEWVTELYYGGSWYPIVRGSLKEFVVGVNANTTAHIQYEDPFDRSKVIMLDVVTGWKFDVPKPTNELEGNKDG